MVQVGSESSARIGAVAPASSGTPSPDPARPRLRVACLVNQYPKTSHSFVRREIAALERLGVAVQRLSLRACADPLVDDVDRAELARTHVVLEQPLHGLLAALSMSALRHPIRTVRAARLAWRLSRRKPGSFLRHQAYFVEACAIVRRLRRSGVQHLHAHFGTNAAAVALLSRTLGGPPFSFTVHGPEEFDAPDALALDVKMEHAAFTVAISDFGRSQLLRRAPYRAWSKVVVVRCGVDEGWLQAPPTPLPTAPRLVSVGRLCEQKGQLLLIDAVARLRGEGRPIELVLIGDGPMRAALERRIGELELRDTVRLLGARGGTDVRAEIRAARALVLPSFAEGLPVVLMEALAIRRPVIATAVAGIPELVRPAENGWLVPPGNVEALAAAMRAALDAPLELLERFGDAGRQLVEQRHDVAREASRLLDHMTAPGGRGR